MANGYYQPNMGPNSATAQLMRSSEMARFMDQQGKQGARVAQTYTQDPTAIRTELVQTFGRWCVNIQNTSPMARREEYGSRYTRATAPLGHALSYFWSKDPNFWRRTRR